MFLFDLMLNDSFNVSKMNRDNNNKSQHEEIERKNRELLHVFILIKVFYLYENCLYGKENRLCLRLNVSIIQQDFRIETGFP